MKKLSKQELEKRWQQATIKRDVIFTKTFGDNKALTLELLNIILPELKIKEIIDIVPEDRQKENIVYRGVRFDVYAKDEKGRGYDIEMQVVNHHDLGKRIAFYQNKLSSRALNPGQYFFEKRDTYVIFVCDFDYFNQGLPIYHTTMRLEEDLNKVVDTGEYNVILNSRAKDFSSVSPEVKAFLDTRDSFMDWEEKLAEERYYTDKEAREEERSSNISGVIQELNDDGMSKEQVIRIVSNSFKITKKEAQEYYDKELAIK
ncbi:Rpn family recombination-promoting nuclease/putative transposase [Ligilactobacillus salivarius]|uniref:Rpn family recombination-promoting nuclease/putative transposase n=1 Tax=Ligilactobacillus salivarius TaxID=1624 RepID=UPI001CDA9767|nr:Rpn family recombination-promoting nuclease/putative transposase [Ligilactobacillus salivarius]